MVPIVSVYNPRELGELKGAITTRHMRGGERRFPGQLLGIKNCLGMLSVVGRGEEIERISLEQQKNE